MWYLCSFHDPLDGIQFVLALQLSLLKLPWPDKLLEQPQAASVRDLDGGVLLFAGLRLRAVLHTGWPTTTEVQHIYGDHWQLTSSPRDMFQHHHVKH